jgi:hypothetical protein
MGRPETHEAARRDPARRLALAGGLVAAAAALLLLGTAVIPSVMPGAAWAHEDGGAEDGGADAGHEDGGHEDGGQSGGSGRGKGGSHDEGHDDSSHDDTEGGHESGGKGGRAGSKGGGHDDGAEGGHEGGGGEGRGGPGGGGEGDGGGRGQGAGGAGRPVWAQEGIPEVELGRLNVARSPDHVLDRAYAEALSTFSEEVAAFYRLDLASMERELATNWDNIRIIDSPLQNLALLRDALDGNSALREVGITTDNDTLLAVFLGTASDKSMPVTTDTALAISAILGQPLSQTEAAALAEEAERIRQAILEGHG